MKVTTDLGYFVPKKSKVSGPRTYHIQAEVPCILILSQLLPVSWGSFWDLVISGRACPPGGPLSVLNCQGAPPAIYPATHVILAADNDNLPDWL